MTDSIFEPEVSVVAHGLEGKVIMIYGTNNTGKAQPVDTLIPTPNGIKKLGDIKSGDYVFNKEGRPVLVVKTYPQGFMDNYKVTLSDGRVTYCNDEHLWSYYTSKDNINTKSLKEMVERGIVNNNGIGYRFQIPMNTSVEYGHKEFRIDPYVVGVFLGDGCCVNNTPLTLSSKDEDLVKEVARLINAEGYKPVSNNNYSWIFCLKPEDAEEDNMGRMLLNFNTKKFFEGFENSIIKKSYEKSIPEEYLMGDEEQRFALLQGLMDTDGSISATGEYTTYNCRYSTSSKKMADQFIDLINSLGLYGTIHEDKREGERIAYEISINCDNDVKENLFRLERKRALAIEAKNKVKDKKYDRISIVSVEKMPEQKEMVCLLVDDEKHLYLTNNYIVTHNTYSCVRMKKPLFLMCENGLGAQAGVKHKMINNWRMFTKYIKELTDPKTVEKAKAIYSTIVIDEVYASSLFCQKFVCDTYGGGCISLGANENSKVNLYQIYERIYWEQIQKLVTSGYTVVFVAHADEKDNFIQPKGDKRCIKPIVDNCDVVAYLEPNGVDEDGHVIKSSAYFAQTDKFFARSRYDYMVTKIDEFSADNLEKAISDAITKQEEADGIKSVSYDEQQSMYEEKEAMSFEQLQEEIAVWGGKLASSDHMETLTDIVEQTLGVGKKVSQCTKKQMEAMNIILEDIKDACAELGVA